MRVFAEFLRGPWSFVQAELHCQAVREHSAVQPFPDTARSSRPWDERHETQVRSDVLRVHKSICNTGFNLMPIYISLVSEQRGGCYIHFNPLWTKVSIASWTRAWLTGHFEQPLSFSSNICQIESAEQILPMCLTSSSRIRSAGEQILPPVSNSRIWPAGEQLPSPSYVKLRSWVVLTQAKHERPLLSVGPRRTDLPRARSEPCPQTTAVGLGQRRTDPPRARSEPCPQTTGARPSQQPSLLSSCSGRLRSSNTGPLACAESVWRTTDVSNIVFETWLISSHSFVQACFAIMFWDHW